MKKHRPELVSALLDGQLTGIRRWLVQRHVNRCIVCSVEYRRQHHVQQMLRNNFPVATMSETPEFFWSQVQRGIEAAGNKTIHLPAPRLGLFDWLGQHQNALASATAAVLILTGTALWLNQTRHVVAVAMVEDVSTGLPDTNASAYPTGDKGTSVIWVSGLPWAPDISEMHATLQDGEI
jgi:hypothetical protein